MSFSGLRALHAHIGSAIDELEGLYRERSQPDFPLEPPLLDIPYYVAGPHSACQELVEKLTADPAVARASRQIVAACGQLSATVHRPWYGLLETIEAGHLAACLRFLASSHIVEILRETGPQGLHSREICRAVAELRPDGARPDPRILTPERASHILRALATSHWLREVMPDVFANNRRSSFLDSGKTIEQLRTEDRPEKKHVDSNGAAAIVGTIGDEMFKSMAYLTEWLLPDTRVGAMPTVDAQGPLHPARTEDEGAAAQGLLSTIAPSAEEKHQAPFNLAFGTDRHLFEWLELPENSARLARFGHAMLSTREMETTDEILRGYPWADLPPGSVLVDVGGGIGSSSMDVVQAYPHISVVVEDRPQVVETAVLFWGPQYAPLFESGRLSWRVRDIFAPWTPLPDARVPDVFLLRLVLHDWPDAEAQLILSHLRSGAGPNTKLVIGETLLTYASKTEDGASLAQDGSPLLPNLGAGNMHGYLVDISMMGLVSGKERTECEMSELALAAGWKIVEVRRSPGSLWAYATAVPVG